MTSPLGPEDFPQFFQELWGRAPFPWQQDLAAEVCRGHGWPESLALPTGAGKTAALDIALFHLALEAGRKAERQAPCRVALVVDRRIVVDGAHERATHIADRLRKRKGETVARVADRLAELAEDRGDPLRAVRLRGGLPFEPDWARTPAQPTIIVSTVDQVGSRLLFRGYGLSNRMWPIHAGLLGSDTLYLVDEAHLSEPFVQTLKAVAARIDADGGRRPPRVVTMTATPLGAEKGLTEADWTNKGLSPRLKAAKLARLLDAKTLSHDKNGEPVPRFVDALVEAAWNLSSLADAKTRRTHSPCPDAPVPEIIVVVVNRVALARKVAEKLRGRLDEGQADTTEASADTPDATERRPRVLLRIGRARPLDREAQQDDDNALKAGKRVRGGGPPTFVVATQTVEVGADLDFDALVTQAAPLDCLRQRFGRLDRLGQRGQSPAVIVLSREDQQKPEKADDPLYGPATAHTVKWLRETATDDVVNFGIAHLTLPERKQLEKMVAPRRYAPLLLPAYIEKWRKTAPPPHADPATAPFLHGPEAAQPDVTLVWRADLPDPLAADGTPDRIREVLDPLPPSAAESLAVPLAAARAWLNGARPAPLADVEGGAEKETAGEGTEDGATPRLAVRWTGDDPKIVTARDLRPGDTLVVPAEYGGCDDDGWAPDSKAPVRDHAEAAALRRGRLVLRLTEERLAAALADEKHTGTDPEAPARPRSAIWGDIAEILEAREDKTLPDLLKDLQNVEGLPEAWRERLGILGATGLQPLVPYRDRPGAILVAKRRLQPEELERLARSLVPDDGAPATESDAGSFGRAVTLREHGEDVAQKAAELAAQAGLPDKLVHDLALAGRLHDLGKAEPRFQILLHGGDELAALAAETPLAKGDTTSGRAHRRARRLAGLTRGARHECWSVAAAARHPDLADAHDPELVLWLIGTHHGHGRPFFPPVAESTGASFTLGPPFAPESVTVPVAHGLQRLDSGWSARARRLEERHGVWGLAHLEAILRLADHRASEAGAGDKTCRDKASS